MRIPSPRALIFGSENPPETDLVTGDVFKLLRNQRRRWIIDTIAIEGPIRLADLTDIITARENDCTVEQVTSDQRKPVYVALYQSHLPKLEQVDVLDREGSQSGTYSPGPEFDNLAETLDSVRENHPHGEADEIRPDDYLGGGE